MSVIKSSFKAALVIGFIMFLLGIRSADTGSLYNPSSDGSYRTYNQAVCTTHPFFGGVSGEACDKEYNVPENAEFGYTLGEIIKDPKKYKQVRPDHPVPYTLAFYLAALVTPLTLAALIFTLAFIGLLPINFIVAIVKRKKVTSD